MATYTGDDETKTWILWFYLLPNRILIVQYFLVCLFASDFHQTFSLNCIFYFLRFVEAKDPFQRKG